MKPGEDIKPLINFIVYLLVSGSQELQKQTLEFCLDLEARRYFAEFFLLVMNEGISFLNKKLNKIHLTSIWSSFS